MLIISPDGRTLTSAERWRFGWWFVLLVLCGMGLPVLLTMRLRIFPDRRVKLSRSNGNVDSEMSGDGCRKE